MVVAEIFKDIILETNTSIRINANRVLQELYGFHPSFVKGLMQEIVLSLKGEDESIADSADHQALITLTLIIQGNPVAEYSRITQMASRLSTAAQKAVADFPKIILENETFRVNQPAFCQQLVSDLIKAILAAG